MRRAIGQVDTWGEFLSRSIRDGTSQFAIAPTRCGSFRSKVAVYEVLPAYHESPVSRGLCMDRAGGEKHEVPALTAQAETSWRGI